MYISAIDAIALEIPKNGSTTLKAVAEARYGKVQFPGHLKASAICNGLGRVPRRCFALVRHPVDRFVSALNHSYGDNKRVNLDDAIDAALRQGRTIVFWRQSDFIDVDMPVRLMRLADFSVALLGSGVTTHRNRSIRRWGADEIRAHPRFDDFADLYRADFDLWAKAGTQKRTVKDQKHAHA